MAGYPVHHVQEAFVGNDDRDIEPLIRSVVVILERVPADPAEVGFHKLRSYGHLLILDYDDSAVIWSDELIISVQIRVVLLDLLDALQYDILDVDQR